MVFKARVYATRNLPGGKIAEMQRTFSVETNREDRAPTGEELVKGVKGKDAMLCLLTDAIDSGVMDSGGKQLRIISNYAVGFNNIDVKAATERGIVVTNTPGVVTNATAELAVTLMLSVARRIVEADGFSRKGEFSGWGFHLLGSELRGKTLGVIGFGRIGKTVGEICSKGFGMNVIYNDEIVNDGSGFAKKVAIEELLKTSDFISIHAPLLENTKHLISRKQLEMMKSTAILVNTARGPIVDEKALAAALKEKKIAGAGLDVYEREPEIEKELLGLDNVILSPHLGTSTIETRTAMADMAASAILDFFAGRIPKNVVNKEVLERHKQLKP